jgi:hypothetical protein
MVPKEIQRTGLRSRWSRTDNCSQRSAVPNVSETGMTYLKEGVHVGRWNLGWTHWFRWSSLSSVWTLAKEERIKNGFTRGNRWISAATFGVKDGK